MNWIKFSDENKINLDNVTHIEIDKRNKNRINFYDSADDAFYIVYFDNAEKAEAAMEELDEISKPSEVSF